MALSGKIEVEDSRTAVEERQWIEGARQGNEADWVRLMQMYQTPVFRLAYLILGDTSEAEEVTQDVFVRAFLALDRFDAARPLRPWLMQITRNLARNRRRHLGRYWAAIQRWWQHEPQPEGFDSSNPREEAQILWQAIKKLRPSAQEIIYLRYFLEMSETEIGSTLNIRPGTVKSRLHRALKQLRQVAEQDFPELT